MDAELKSVSPVLSVVVTLRLYANPAFASVGVQLNTTERGAAPVDGNTGVNTAPAGTPLALRVTVAPASGSVPVAVNVTGVPGLTEIANGLALPLIWVVGGWLVWLINRMRKSTTVDVVASLTTICAF